MLLLVVLSLLVLFMLIGTAFLMSSSQYRTSSKAAAKLNRVGNFATDLLDRGLMAVLRDTENPHSAVRYHSLLRDMYGTDGFEAVVYSPLSTVTFSAVPPINPATQVTRFAEATSVNPLGPTQGQLIDIYVRALPHGVNDPLTTSDDLLSPTALAMLPFDLRHVIQLERDANGNPQIHPLPLTKGYYNGCLLTITSGPARGQTTRIVEYEYVDTIPPPTTPDGTTNLYRFRVMAFSRSDGLPLQVDQTSTHAPEIVDLAGATFMVNGRPFSGTGVGYNPLAAVGTPRLSALQGMWDSTGTLVDAYEIALLPNATTFQPFHDADTNMYYRNDVGTPLPLESTLDLNEDGELDPFYVNFPGPGDVNESYDAADFQNMFLALQTVTPRSRGRVVWPDGFDPDLEPDRVDVERDNNNNGTFDTFEFASNFLRLDLEDLPLPSFHRPDLINYWYHRLLNSAWLQGEIGNDDDRVRAILQPYQPNGTRSSWVPSDDVAAQILAIKRKISLRPLREDHPNFDGGNPYASEPDFSDSRFNGNNFVKNENIAIPYWEAVGPWDVDNDNDGVPDSVWVDVGEPVQQAEDGTLYKPLYAYLIMDLDSRLNVNAHGLAEHMRAPALAANKDSFGDYVPGPNLAGVETSDLLSHGLGYGPAEISLRPILSPALPSTAPALMGLPSQDDYARLLAGRPGSPQWPNVWGRHGSFGVWNAAAAFTMQEALNVVRPGMTFDKVSAAAAAATTDPLAALAFIGHPGWLSEVYNANPAFRVPTAFGTPPDLMCRYALGLDFAGQPVYEAAADYFVLSTSGADGSLLVDSPYELDLSNPTRRDSPDPNAVDAMVGLVTSGPYVDVNDDAPFATAELERILRAYDADSGAVPDRLWNVVDAFDPVKLLENQPAAVDDFARKLFGLGPADPLSDSQMLAAAQRMAGVNRRLVTTDSYDLPVPAQNLPQYARQPNVQSISPILPESVFRTLTGKEFSQATIVDLLGYRMQRARATSYDLNDPAQRAAYEWDLGQLAQQLLPPEIIAGQRMDLNRPFGDGRDNAGDGFDNDGDGTIDEPSEPGDPYVNGVADDPLEAGDPFVDSIEPFTDSNGNGIYDAGEPYTDLNGNNQLDPNGRYDPGEYFVDIDGNGQLKNTVADYTPPRDRLWIEATDPVNGPVREPMAFDYNHGGNLLEGRLIDVDADGNPDGRLRYNGTMQRQTMARHLYVLMLLLTDEDYLATQNVQVDEEGNIQPVLPDSGIFNDLFMVEELARRIAQRESGNPVPTSAQIDAAKLKAWAWTYRKLTARQIAQWAINCVDFRDADAVMTPFEYDENPWDGWGVVDDSGTFVPLDGDPATNENWGDDFPVPKKFNYCLPITPANPNNDASPARLNGAREAATRDVVWGAERPELLITETLALHDRRCTDEGGPGSIPTNLKITEEPGEGQLPDYDLDQRLKPRGSLFVELYNPWSPEGEKPAELYGTPAGAAVTAEKGVMLSRLSDVGVRGPNLTIKYSPVWRMTVLRDPIGGRLTNTVIDVDDFDTRTQQDEEAAAYAAQLMSIDLDGFGVDSDKNTERHVYFTTDGDGNRENDSVFAAATPGIPAEWELVAGVLVPQMNQIKVRVPPLPYRLAENPSAGAGEEPYPAARRYFIARTERRREPANPNNDTDVPIAPILPGRYAVVGSSGLQLSGSGPSGNLTPSTPDGGLTTRFVTPISRLLGNEESDFPDRIHRQRLGETRRIELWPSTDPEVQQLLVGENGGPEFVTFNGTNYINVTDSAGGVGTNPDGVPDANVVAPAVAIPVEDLNISEPTEGYPSLRYQRAYYDRIEDPLNTEPPRLNDQGELEYETEYDRPLDMEFELVRNGTTQNYRTVHLQRLANPALPWNPPPFDEAGNENTLHVPTLPVNPYLTIDSQSVDLTAYNGASEYERNLPTLSGALNDGGLGASNIGQDLTQEDYLAPLPAGEYQNAPYHVVWGIVNILEREKILASDWWENQPVPDNVCPVTPVDVFREMAKTQESTVEGFLTALETKRGGNTQTRGILTNDTRIDDHDRDWGGDWGWHLYRRVLPDDQLSENLGITGSFLQRLHVKSLERGAKHRWYDYPKDSAWNEGWKIDYSWEPRLIWKQEPPNVTWYLTRGGVGQPKKVSSLKNTTSRRVLKGSLSGAESTTLLPQDMIDRNVALWSTLSGQEHVFDYVLEQTLGFANESFAPELDRATGFDEVAMIADPDPKPGAPEVVAPTDLQAPDQKELDYMSPQQSVRITSGEELLRRERLTRSTYPWLTWNDRPYVSADEILQVPAASSSLMLHNYSVINFFTPNPYDGDDDPNAPPKDAALRLAVRFSPFGHLLNFFTTSIAPARTTEPTAFDEPFILYGAPHFYRILEFVQVPSRYVGTETMLSPEVFNDDPTRPSTLPNDPDDITGPTDPRYNFQPPFNQVSRERDPGKVNLNTVVGRRLADPAGAAAPQIWSEVYDGIMQRYHDGNLFDSATGSLSQLGHFGPAWRDVVLSRKGFAQFNADDPGMDTPLEKPASGAPPDVYTFGLNRGFPTVFANPFRSPDAGDLVPLDQMMQYGVDASWLRVHPRNLGGDGRWGVADADDDELGAGLADDMREAGFGDDEISHRGPNQFPGAFRAIPEEEFDLRDDRALNPLFSETAPVASIDPYRNPYMMYEPMTRLDNLVTTRSNVYAIWVAVGYFEVERAPDWNDSDPTARLALRKRFGGTNNDADPATIAGRAMYDRVYPEGYMLGRELGSDTGDVRRERAFYIIDRTLPVGFKPGEDTNVENLILVRRRIE